MKIKRLIKFIPIIVLIFGINLSTSAQDDSFNNSDTIIINYNSSEVNQTNNEVIRLKSEKNELLNTIREKDKSIRYLALVLTVVSFLFIIFLFAYFSVRRKKRIELEERRKINL